MAATVGSVDILLRPLLGAFRKDVVREATAAADEAGTKAGASFGQKFSGFAGKAIAAGLAGAFAVATKGALELDSASRKAAASMGLAESELAGFRSQINELSKTNPTKSFAEIADVAATVRNEMGLTGESMLAMTQQMLDWSKVTGQDAVSATRDLDKALDAYNLTAKDGAKLQDALVAAQRTGAGPASENLKLLSEMAPALTAANLGWQEGVGLLQAFGEAGVDAASAPRALQTALSKVKSPQELQKLIENIRSTENDFARAALATELFGAKAGARMALLLKPGSTALQNVKLDVDSFAGATSKAADLVDDSFANRITSAVRTFVTGPLAELGANAPGVLAAVAGLGAIVSAVKGLDGILTAVSASAAARWALILGPLAIGGAAVAVGGLALQDPIGDLINGVLGLGKEFDALQRGGFGSFKADTQAAGVAATQLSANLQAASADIGQFADSVDGVGIATSQAADEVGNAADQIIDDMSGLPVEATGWLEDWTDIAGQFSDAYWNQVPPTLDAALAMALAIRDGIEGGREDILGSYGNLIKDQAGALTRMQELAILGGVLASGKLQAGLASGNPQIEADTNALVLSIAKRLDALGPGAYQAGLKAAQQFLAGWANKSNEFKEFNKGEFESAQVIAAQGTGAGLLAGLLDDISSAGVKIKPFAGDVTDLSKALGLSGDEAEKAGKKTKGKSDADREAAQAAKEHTAAVKGKLTDALREAKTAALDYFSRVHDKNLRAIRDEHDRTRATLDDARKRIQAHLDEVRATAEAPVTAAEQAQQATEDARTFRDLQERLAEARAGGDVKDVRSAEEALQSFQARQAISAMRAAAQTTIAAAEVQAKADLEVLDAIQRNEDEKTALLIKAENDRYEAQKAAFDKQFTQLSKALLDGKGEHQKINGEIEALYAAFGITMEKAGEEVGTKFAAGLIASKNAIEAAATELAAVIAKYLKTSSPAEAGPMHRTSPEEMGRRIVGGLRRGMDRELDALRATVGTVARVPLPFAAAASGSSGRGLSSSIFNRTSNITIHNPLAEPASVSLRQRLQLVAADLSGD